MRSSKMVWLMMAGLLVLMAGACSVTPTPSTYVPERPMAWYSLSEAQALSLQTNRPMMILLYSPGCPYCHQMIESTLVDPEVQSYVKQHFIPVMATSMEAPQLFRAWAVESVPTTVIVAPNGQRLASLSGYRPAADFLGQLKGVAGQ